MEFPVNLNELDIIDFEFRETETIAGKDGVTYTPNVNEAGIISWTNDGGLPNPPSRDIHGKTAYQYAVQGGFVGTEQEFMQMMSSIESFVSEAQESAASALNSSDESAASATLSESWAVGNTGTREGENLNNAKYWAEVANSDVELAQSSASSAALSESNALGYSTSASGSAQIATSKANESQNNALKSEGFAIGQQNGTNVKSDSPYYNNNSKYYSEMASQHASNANTAKTEAQGYASSASESESNASAYKDLALGYKNSAQTYAGNASTSEANALQYKNDAGSAKSSAESARDQALAYKNDAGVSATSASESSTSAQMSSNSASTYASNALSSKLDSEAWATGTRNGSDVPATDPAYHNNAKYYMEQAKEAVGENVMLKTEYDPQQVIKNAGGIAEYVDANGGKIDHVQVNGVEQEISNKTINLSVIENPASPVPGQFLKKTENGWETDDVDVSGAIETHNTSSDAHSTLFNTKENVSNKTQQINASSTSAQYPSAKTVYDIVYTPLNNEIEKLNGYVEQGTSSSNKLVNVSTMNEAISSVEAKQLYKTNEQGSFATKAELTSATSFFNADGSAAVPTKNDIAYVLSDESHDGKSAKYVIAKVEGGTITWGFVIAFSDVTFTQTQMNAVNSGINSTKVAGYDSHTGNSNIHVTQNEKSEWSGKSVVSANNEGTSTNDVTYITIDGVEYRLSVKDIKALAFKDRASGTYSKAQSTTDGTSLTPAGTVSSIFTGEEATIETTYTPEGSVSVSPTITYNKADVLKSVDAELQEAPTFSGTQGNVSVTGTPTTSVANHSYTPEGSVSKPNVNISPTTDTVYSIDDVGTLPTRSQFSYAPAGISASVSGTRLILRTVQNATAYSITGVGTLPTKGNGQTVLTGVTAALASEPTFTGTTATLQHSVTNPAITSTGNFTPEGSVSKPAIEITPTTENVVTGTNKLSASATFVGTQANIGAVYTPEGTIESTFAGTPHTHAHSLKYSDETVTVS